MEDRSDKMRRYMSAAQAAGSKVASAELMVQAAKTELEAALTLGDWEMVEKARENCVLKFEFALDVQITELRKLKDMGSPYL